MPNRAAFFSALSRWPAQQAATSHAAYLWSIFVRYIADGAAADDGGFDRPHAAFSAMIVYSTPAGAFTSVLMLPSVCFSWRTWTIPSGVG